MTLNNIQKWLAILKLWSRYASLNMLYTNFWISSWFGVVSFPLLLFLLFLLERFIIKMVRYGNLDSQTFHLTNLLTLRQQNRKRIIIPKILCFLFFNQPIKWRPIFCWGFTNENCLIVLTADQIFFWTIQLIYQIIDYYYFIALMFLHFIWIGHLFSSKNHNFFLSIKNKI